MLKQKRLSDYVGYTLQDDIYNRYFQVKTVLIAYLYILYEMPITTDEYAKFDWYISGGLRVMSIFTKTPQLAKMMLGKPSSPFCMPVAGLLKYLNIQ